MSQRESQISFPYKMHHLNLETLERFIVKCSYFSFSFALKIGFIFLISSLLSFSFCIICKVITINISSDN